MMNLRKIWIPALLLTLLGGTVKLCDTIFTVQGNTFFLNSFASNCFFGVCLVMLYIIGLGMSASDRKKKFRAKVKKNYICGCAGFVASVMIIASGIITQLTQTSGVSIECIMSIAAGGILLYESCISFTGHNGMKKAPILGLIMPVWCTLRFIALYGQNNQKSLVSMEWFDVIYTAILILFLFYHSMLLADVNHSQALRRTAVYGTCFIAAAVVACTDMFIRMGNQPVRDNVDKLIVEPTLVNLMTYIGDLALCVYAALFIRDMLKSAEDTIVDEDDDEAVTVSASAGAETVKDGKKSGAEKTKKEKKTRKAKKDEKAESGEEKPEQPDDEEKAEEPDDKPDEAADEENQDETEDNSGSNSEADESAEEPEENDEVTDEPAEAEAAAPVKPDEAEGGSYDELLQMLDDISENQ